MRRYTITFFVSLFIGSWCMASTPHASAIDIRGGFIILQATANGHHGSFILDTGAPGLVLNSKYTNGNTSNQGNLQGVNGAVHTTTLKQWTFRWNGFESHGQDAYVIDLSYLEHAAGTRIDGLVGLDVFDGYYVLIDYLQGTLELWNSVPKVISRQPSVSFPLEFQDHVPVVILQRNQQRFRFALDSGSESHLIDRSTAETWAKSIEQRDAIELVGADQTVQRTFLVEASDLFASGIALPPTQFIMTDLSAVTGTTGTKLDGVLGQPLIENRIVLIDRDRKYIRLSPRIDMDNLAESGLAPSL